MNVGAIVGQNAFFRHRFFNRRAAVVTGTIVGIEQRPHGHEVRIDLEDDQTYVLGAILAEALIRRA